MFVLPHVCYFFCCYMYFFIRVTNVLSLLLFPYQSYICMETMSVHGITHHSGVSLASSHLSKHEEMNTNTLHRPVSLHVHVLSYCTMYTSTCMYYVHVYMCVDLCQPQAPSGIIDIMNCFKFVKKIMKN